MPRNKYPEETVEKILDASLKLFLEKGYENTTILDIVDQMGGMTRGAFYHHFKSKEEVMDALTDRMFYENNPFEKVKRRSDLNGLQKLQAIMEGTTDQSEYRKLSAEALPLLQNPMILAKFIESNQEVLVPAYQELIEEGIQDGSVSTLYSKQTAEILTFLTNFWTIPTLYPYTNEEIIQRIQMIKEITAFMGIPVLDDELIQQMKEMLNEDCN